MAVAYPMMSGSFIFRFLQSFDASMRNPSETDAANSGDHSAANAELEHCIVFPGPDVGANPAGQHHKHGKKRQRPSAVKVNALLRALG